MGRSAVRYILYILIYAFVPCVVCCFYAYKSIHDGVTIDTGIFTYLDMLLYIIVLVWFIFVIFRFLWEVIKKNWLKSLLTSISLICVLPLIWVINMSRDYVHFAIMYPSYASQLGNADVKFRWGCEFDSTSPADEICTDLIYDMGGNMLNEIRLRNLAFKHSDPAALQHIVGKFYVYRYVP